MTPGGIAARAINGALNTFSAGLAVEMRIARGATREAAIEAAAPVPLRQSPLFNPTLDYVQFLLAAIMPTVLQIFICAGAVLSFSRDRHTKAGIARVLRLGKTPLRATAGKLLPYTFTYGLTLIAADAIIFGFFGAFSWQHAAACRLGLRLHPCQPAARRPSGPVAGRHGRGARPMRSFDRSGFRLRRRQFSRIVMNGFSVAWGRSCRSRPICNCGPTRLSGDAGGDIAAHPRLAAGAAGGLWPLTLLQFRRTARPAVRVKAEPPVGETP